MKTAMTLIFTLFFTGLTASVASADHKSVNGALIGAGSGALLGQAIGGDTESTVFGTAVGGMIGYVIGHELERDGKRVVHYKPHRYDRRYKADRRYHSHKHINTGRPFGKQYSSRDHTRYRDRDKVCKKVVRVKEYHGRTKRVVTKKCWYEDDHDRYSRSYRKYDRHYRYDRDF